MGNLLSKVRKALGFGGAKDESGIDDYESASELLERRLSACDPYNDLALERTNSPVKEQRYSAEELKQHREVILAATEALSLVAQAFNELRCHHDLRAAAGKVVAANCAIYKLAVSRYAAAAAIALASAERLVSDVVLLDIKLAALEERISGSPEASGEQRRELQEMRRSMDQRVENSRSMEARARVARDEANGLIHTAEELEAVVLAAASA